jgi:hypothetical protein
VNGNIGRDVKKRMAQVGIENGEWGEGFRAEQDGCDKGRDRRKEMGGGDTVVEEGKGLQSRIGEGGVVKEKGKGFNKGM